MSPSPSPLPPPPSAPPPPPARRPPNPSPPPPPSAAMRIIVPLQGVVQGRGGVFWGSLIPCALFYFLQLYIRQRRPNPPGDDDDPPSPSPPVPPDSALPSRGSSSNLSRVSSSGDFSVKPSESSQGSRSGFPSRSPRRPPFVSSRAIAVSGTGDSPYYIGWKEYYRNPFHPEENPDGVLQLGLAENHLSYDLLQDWLTMHPESCLWNDEKNLTFEDMAPYQVPHGISAFKSVMASFLEELTGGSMQFLADNVLVTAGATAAIEILSFCIAESGDAILVPSPYYPGFDRDIKWRNGIELVPVPCQGSDGFIISKAALEKTYIQTQRRGITVRGLLITTPGNPVGNIIDASTFRFLFDFAREKHIHLISDEVYAASVFKGQFISAAEILASGDYDPNFVHIIYGLSKDFAVPGFRVGILYTLNEKVLSAARNLTRFCGVSTHTQRLLVFLFRDRAFVQRYLDENKKRLGERYTTTVQGLQEVGIPCADTSGGLYCWVDFRHLMTSNTAESEKELWKRLLYEVKINLTPSSACHCPEPGWFRLCFASIDEQTLKAALARLQSFVSTKA